MYDLKPLVQGKYNMNFMLKLGAYRWDVRLNTGSQNGKTLPEQICYEYETLETLEPADVTSKEYLLDDSCKGLPYAVIIMEFIEGEKLDYNRDNVNETRR